MVDELFTAVFFVVWLKAAPGFVSHLVPHHMPLEGEFSPGATLLPEYNP
jgi:hypothetical protein